ncbi:MAG: homocysteine S-methyltransferase family protein [Elusimicrobia bacterium]|nr:homocysteine S-methyltransferase family protein [Elusimicrobiota bacterium]
MNKELKKAVKERILIFDGALGTYLGKFGLVHGDFKGHEGLNEYLSVSRPEVIKQTHSDYLAAGADVVETNTQYLLGETG